MSCEKEDSMRVQKPQPRVSVCGYDLEKECVGVTMGLGHPSIHDNPM